MLEILRVVEGEPSSPCHVTYDDLKKRLPYDEQIIAHSIELLSDGGYINKCVIKGCDGGRVLTPITMLTSLSYNALERNAI